MITLQKVIQLLKDDGRGILIKEVSFIRFSEKAIFIHPIYGEWSAKPYKVIVRKTTHPKEANLQRSISNKNVRKDNKIQQKTQQTNLAKYGAKYASCLNSTKQKALQTNLAKYGIKSYTCTEEAQYRIRKTKLEKYGHEHYNNIPKIQKTLFEKYGVTCIMKHPDIIKKMISTKEQKNIITRPRGISWEELALQLGVPRTSLQAFVRTNPHQDAIDTFIKNRENNITDVENIFIQNFDIKKYTGGIEGYRPDFKLNDNIYVNVDGLYWHSQKVNRKTNYHFKLRKTFENKNLRIIQFRADDLKYKLPIVKSIINNTLLKTNNKIYARKCILKIVSAKEANLFLQQTHLMGGSNSKFIGLYHGSELVSVMGFKIKKSIIDIDRFASKLNTNIVGGLSKLLSYVKKIDNNAKTIHYWVDLRYGTGLSLLKLGFNHVRDIQSWQWTDFKKTYHRSKCRATKEKTQADAAKELGLWQIFDAGQRLYTLTI